MTNDYITEAINKSQEAIKAFDSVLKGLGKTLDDNLKNVPDEHKEKVLETNNQIKKAIAKARLGDTEAVNKIINDIKNGSKNNQ